MRPSFTKIAVMKYLLFAYLFCLLPCPSQAYSVEATETKHSLEIGSFNIQVFGESKVNKPFIRQTLLAIISRYDIVFIQEIRDDKNKAIYDLLKDLNASTGKEYHAIVSKRMGRGEMKEQYAYFFDSAIVQNIDSYVFDDRLDEFAREPYVARFKSLGREFTLAGIHVAPTGVLAELRALGKVYRDIEQKFGDDDMFIMGDMNADCAYYKPHVLGFDFFGKAPRLLITDDMDTSVSPTSCAYDRVFGFGAIQDHVSEGRSFNFMEEYGFDLASTKLVSDHWPIEFTLEGAKSITIPSKPYELELPSTPPEGEDLSQAYPPNICGALPYKTQSGYCYGSFETGKKRVPFGCCT